MIWPAGLLCDFEVEWDIAAGGNQLVFPEQPNGDVVVRNVGRARGTVTNLDSPDMSVLVRGGYRQDLVFHADGTIDAIINGTVIAGYFPTDVGDPRSGYSAAICTTSLTQRSPRPLTVFGVTPPTSAPH